MNWQGEPVRVLQAVQLLQSPQVLRLPQEPPGVAEPLQRVPQAWVREPREPREPQQ